MKLKIRGISFSYESHRALENISFEVKDSEVLGIIGPNGSGKTTLLRCINSTLSLETGVVMLDGRAMSQMDRREIARQIGVVPQLSTISFPFTVFDVVSMGRAPYLKRLGREGKSDFEAVQRAIELTGIRSLVDRFVSELSGGEYQRVIVARALAQEPSILLLDEPTLHLDIKYQLELLELIRKLACKQGLIVIMVSHELNLAGRYCDKLLLLNSGRIYKMGIPDEVLTPDNIRSVYQIEVKVNRDVAIGTLNVIPVSPIEDKDV